MVNQDKVSLRLSVTDRCHLGCLYCRPPGSISGPGARESLSLEAILRFVRQVHRDHGISKIHLTGGEPLLREDIVAVIAALHEAACDVDLALTTNGQRLERHAGALRRAGLRRVNISLDSLNPETFAHITHGGDVAATQAGIAAARAQGLSPIKLNTTVLGGINDHEIVAIGEFALAQGVEARFLELMPIGPVRARYEALFVSAQTVEAMLSRVFALEALPYDQGQSTRRFRVRDRQGRSGTIGLIASSSRPFCQGCRRLRLTTAGELIPCLAQGASHDLSALLETGSEETEADLRAIIADALAGKRQRRGFTTPRTMDRVGG